MYHSKIEAPANHIIHSYEYANSTERLAATGFVAADVGKVAQQQSDKTYWILSNHSPATWLSMSGGSSTSIFGAGYQTEISLARETTTSTSWQDKLTLTTPALEAGTYRVGWHAVIDQSSIADDAQARLYNVTDAVLVGVEQSREPKEGTERAVTSGFAEVIFAGVAKVFKIQYRQQRGGTAGIQDARIEIWRVI